MAHAPENMGFVELREWLADRLRLRGFAAADIDQRTGEAPYDKPLALWQAGGEEFRKTFVRAVRQILRELRAEPWEAEHLHNLMVLLEEGEMIEAGRELTAIACSHAWLRGGQGVERHMLALRGLLGIGCIQTPQFWLEEGQRLDGRYPELVFRGLAAHGLELAFDHLFELAANVHAAKRIAGLLPRLIEQHGQERIRALAALAIGCLEPAVGNYLNEWFPSREFGTALREVPVQTSAPVGGWGITDEIFLVAGVNRCEAETDLGWAGGQANSRSMSVAQFIYPAANTEARQTVMRGYE